MSEEQKPKEKHTVRNIILIILILIIGYCGLSFLSDVVSIALEDQEPAARPATTYTVRYRVGGTASKADITIENESGGTEQKTVNVPWSETFEAERGQFVYVSAQSQDDASRKINCEITVNGETLETAESSGRFVIASCSGSVGR